MYFFKKEAADASLLTKRALRVDACAGCCEAAGHRELSGLVSARLLAAVSQQRCVEWRMGACVRRRAVISLAGHFEVQGGSNNVMRLR